MKKRIESCPHANSKGKVIRFHIREFYIYAHNPFKNFEFEIQCKLILNTNNRRCFYLFPAARLEALS